METPKGKEKRKAALPKPSASSDRSSSSSSGSSVQEIHSVQELCTALGRVSREDRSQRAQGNFGHSFVSPLTRQLSVKLNKLELIPQDQDRSSVIVHTPSRLPTTSTPSNSPPGPPVPPRTCQSLGQSCPPSSSSHSPSCSDISSINCEVFSDSEVNHPKSGERIPLQKSKTIPSDPFSSSELTNSVSVKMQEEEEQILLKQNRLYRNMRVFDPGAVTEDTVGTFDADIKEVKKEFNDLAMCMDKLVIKYGTEMGPERESRWKTQQVQTESDVKDYLKVMNRQAGQFRNSGARSQDGADVFQAEQLKAMRKQNEILERSQQEKENDKAERLSETLREADAKKLAAEARAKNKSRVILKDSDELLEKVNEVGIENWKNETSLSIGRAMRNIKSWEDSLEKIIVLQREMDDIVATHGLNSECTDILQVGVAVQRVTDEVKFAIDAIKAEDDTRELYTLDIAIADKVKLPTFEGLDSEDFSTFKELVEKAFIQNRVTKSDKIEKLREVLKGHAKKLVPESTIGDIDEAWAILEKAFGGADRLMESRKRALLKLGTLPRESARGGLKTQLEWFLEAESLIRKIIDLGNKSNEMAMEAFSPTSIKLIQRMFPGYLQIKLVHCPGTGCAKIQAMLEKIAKFRTDAQDRQLIAEVATVPTHGHGGVSGWSEDVPYRYGGATGGDDYEENFDHDEYGQSYFAGCEVQAHIAYKPPKRDESCRVCKTLELKGDTYQLYDDHLHSYPSGCPRYIAMTVEERLQIACAAKLCLSCHDPEYIFIMRDKDHRLKCPIVVRGKSRFSCSVDNCTQHMWVCVRHKSENRQRLGKFKEEIDNKFGISFGLAVSIPTLAYEVSNDVQMNIKDAKKVNAHTKNDKSNLSPKKVKNLSPRSPRKREFSTPKFQTSESLAALKVTKVKEVQTNSANPETNPETNPEANIPNPNANNCNHESLTSGQAMKRLQKKMSAGGVLEELRPVPKGRAQFIIGYSKGRTRGLLTLYDTGCGAVLFKEGVPQNELGLSVLKTKGPFVVKGVGDTTVKVNDEHMCSLSLADGTRQTLEGWTVDKITATLPTVNLSLAEAEIKASIKESKELQELNCQPTVGGDCDILLGILYTSIFPTAVHSLDNGLTIYKLQATSHDSRYNCAIGGPHESFEFMASHFGSMTIVFANLCQQLESYRKFGPPNICKSIMTVEDMQFAEKFKDWEIENFCQEALEMEIDDQGDVIQEIILGAVDVFDDKNEATIEEIVNISVSCSVCGSDLSEEEVTVQQVLNALPARPADKDDISWKRFQQAQQEGLSIEYRCPKCRSCSDCRRSFETEKVSMREEAEDAMIWDSVEIDWENKRIICYLPLRGAEEEFLTNNRDIAMKILDQQCYKYFKDEETRDLIVKAFDKLLKNGQMVLWKDLTDEEKKTIEAKVVSHYIVWRVVFKPSISTPARTVFDGSQNTKAREDGSGGRCLNDAVVKGRVVTLNLVKLVLRFEIGPEALQGDLKQFYASIKLVQDQWNLQRVLLKENLDPNSEVQEAVIKTLIWGIKCVSAQSETAIIKLAEAIKDTYPLLADFLLNGRFVDDLGTSAETIEILRKLIEEADQVFSQVGLACKGWSLSGYSPPPEVAEEGETVSIGGMKWHTKLDLLEVPLPQLHFSKKLRGRLVVGTEVFNGSLVEDMEKFVPKKLTRRMIVAKNAAVFDLLGKFTPIMAGFSVDLRKAVKETEGWDDPVPEEIRSKWVHNFLRLENLRGIKFQRARMPENAASTEMNLIVAVDASQEVKIVGAWARFRLKSGDFSCQLVIGRSLLVHEDSTIPKNELDALAMGSNLGWILRQTLEHWISSYILIGDSTIALCWVSSEKKRLSLFHRNRCVQIRRGTELDLMYHVISECNPADLGTRPEAVKDSDIGPNSKWEKGLPWMKGEIDDAVEKGILSSINNLRLNNDDEESFNKGLVFEKTPEILTKGHPAVLLSTRAENVKSRSEFSKYVLCPTKFKFEKIVTIYATLWRFIKSFKCLKGRFQKRNLKLKENIRFQMFLTFDCVKGKIGRSDSEPEASTKFQIFSMTPIFTMFDDKDTKHVFNVFDDEYIDQISGENELLDAEKVIDTHRIKALGFGVKKPGIQFKGKYHVMITDDDVSRSLEYLYKKGTQEVLNFNKPELVKKISIEKNGILYSKSRILDCQRFQIAGGLEYQNVLGKGQFGINVVTPVLDRHSPLSYSISHYIHRKISRHGGYETCLRDSLNICFIIQGMSLFREIGEDCVKCAKLRKRFLDISMGPVADEQLTIAPPFWVTMVDIYGPCYVYVPGHSMQTRNRKIIDVKCYVLTFVCPTTKLVNLQVIESKSADGVVEGISRLGCEAGFPSFVLADQESSILKVLREAEVSLKDLQLILYKERGIKFRTCPVSGHNYHGGVERKIKTVQDCLEKIDVANLRLHATGLQTLLKLIENDLNNLPLGYSYNRDSDNSPLLKLIFPNMLKIGRLNTRAMDGPIRMPAGPGEMMKKIEKGYSSFFDLWNTTMIPKLMKMNKWFDTKSQLVVGDIVYFRKVESELASKWTVGKIVDVTKSKDGLVRRVDVQYQNSTENEPRVTDRAARSLIKLFNIDDTTWQDDMDEVEKLVEAIMREDEDPGSVASINSVRSRHDAVGGYDRPQREEGVQHRPVAQVARAKLLKSCQSCCCQAHCVITDHSRSAVPVVVDGINYRQDHFYAGLLDRSWLNLE